MIRRRKCPRCGTLTPAANCCGIELAAKRRQRWRMSSLLVRQVHAVARRQKGLDEETYRLRLGAVGVESCKQFTRLQYKGFMHELAKLPDAFPQRRRMA